MDEAPVSMTFLIEGSLVERIMLEMLQFVQIPNKDPILEDVLLFKEEILTFSIVKLHTTAPFPNVKSPNSGKVLLGS